MASLKYFTGKDKQLLILIAMKGGDATVGELGKFIRPRADWIAAQEGCTKAHWGASDHDSLGYDLKVLVREGLIVDTGMTRSPHARVYDVTPAGIKHREDTLEKHPRAVLFRKI